MVSWVLYIFYHNKNKGHLTIKKKKEWANMNDMTYHSHLLMHIYYIDLCLYLVVVAAGVKRKLTKYV